MGNTFSNVWAYVSKPFRSANFQRLPGDAVDDDIPIIVSTNASVKPANTMKQIDWIDELRGSIVQCQSGAQFEYIHKQKVLDDQKKMWTDQKALDEIDRFCKEYKESTDIFTTELSTKYLKSLEKLSHIVIPDDNKKQVALSAFDANIIQLRKNFYKSDQNFSKKTTDMTTKFGENIMAMSSVAA